MLNILFISSQFVACLLLLSNIIAIVLDRDMDVYQNNFFPSNGLAFPFGVDRCSILLILKYCLRYFIEFTVKISVFPERFINALV